MRLVAKKLGPKAIALGPSLPVEGAWLWGAFCALDAKRDLGMGVGPILYTEMVAYAYLWGFRWAPAEIAIIDALDRAYRVFRSQQQNKTIGEGS